MIHSGAMTRYIRRFSRIGHSLGPSEERGFALWVGYDVADAGGDLSGLGLIEVDGWSDADLAARGVTAFRKTTIEELKRWKS